jgi:hypothetical protein
MADELQLLAWFNQCFLNDFFALKDKVFASSPFLVANGPKPPLFF